MSYGLVVTFMVVAMTICGPPEPPRGSQTLLNDHRYIIQRLYVLYNVFGCLGLIMVLHDHCGEVLRGFKNNFVGPLG